MYIYIVARNNRVTNTRSKFWIHGVVVSGYKFTTTKTSTGFVKLISLFTNNDTVTFANSKLLLVDPLKSN